MKLTAKQIKEIDEIADDRKAADMTLQTALRHHSNCMNEVNKRAANWWDEMAKIHDLDMSIRWQVKGGVIVKIEDDE